MNKTVGVITGKFAPLHTGHIYAITEAATQVDVLYVVLSYDEKFIQNLPDRMKDKLTLKKRMLWLKRTFSDMDHIKIICVDESDMKPYPEGVPQWCSEVNNLLSENGVTSIDKWFSSEPEYSWWIKEHFNCENIVIDSNRDMINISATKIRNNPYKYWEYLPSIVRKEFLLKVVLIGEESCAKSMAYIHHEYSTSRNETFKNSAEKLYKEKYDGKIVTSSYEEADKLKDAGNKNVVFVNNAGFVKLVEQTKSHQVVFGARKEPTTFSIEDLLDNFENKWESSMDTEMYEEWRNLSDEIKSRS